MRRRRLFLQWAVIASLVMAGAAYAAVLGWFELAYALDVTKLCMVILALFTGATAWCGALTWRLDDCATHIRSAEARRLFLKDLKGAAEHGWFVSGLCEKLGLTGTVFGFVIMLIGGFQNISASDPQSVQLLLGRLSTGMSTAFITTLVGVVCSIILSVQYHRLERQIEDLKP